MKTSRSSLVPVLAALLLVLAVAPPAFAHAELRSADPEDKAVLATPPTVVTLRFTEGLDQARSSFKLNGPSGTVGTGRPAEQGAKVMTLEGLTLAPGVYGIQWTAAADDGHVERGKLSFTVIEPTPAPATPSPTPPPTQAPSSAAAAAPTAAASEAPASAAPATDAPAPTAAASPVQGDDLAATAGTGTDVLVPIAVGLVLVAGLGAFLFSRSRRA